MCAYVGLAPAWLIVGLVALARLPMLNKWHSRMYAFVQFTRLNFLDMFQHERFPIKCEFKTCFAGIALAGAANNESEFKTCCAICILFTVQDQSARRMVHLCPRHSADQS